MNSIRKAFALLIALTMIFALSACGSSSEQGSAPEQSAAEQPAAEQPAAEQPAAEQPAAEQPSAEQPAAPESEPAAEGTLSLIGKGTSYDEEMEYNYSVYTSYLPEVLNGAEDSDADEEYFDAENEYESENLYYSTSLSFQVYSDMTEEEALSHLESRSGLSSNQWGYEFGEITTVKGDGYTVYYLFGVKNDDTNTWEFREVNGYAVVLFDNELLSLLVDLDASAQVNRDPDAEGVDANSDFQPGQYIEDAQAQFLLFLNSLSFEKEEVQP